MRENANIGNSMYGDVFAASAELMGCKRDAWCTQALSKNQALLISNEA